jgi:hypothetical protein
MRRILLICAGFALLSLPAAAAGADGRAHIGWLVVRAAANDGGVVGPPVATVVVRGFVLGRIAQQGSVEIYQLGASNAAQPQVTGQDVSHHAVSWRGVSGSEWTGSGFRFRAVGGVFRMVVRGSGVYLFAGGTGNVTVQGSKLSPGGDGSYAIDGGRFRSLPSRPARRPLGRS